MLHRTKQLMQLVVLFATLYASAVPAKVKVLSDVSYGKDAKQVFDVYIPERATEAPVILMVHGGAWRGGDKANKAEFENKVAHWVSKGFIFISTNYRTLPELRPVEQTDDIAAAMQVAQAKVGEWGGSAEKFILMGHSSGAHLVSLFSSNYQSIIDSGVKPWLGTISLDISGYDIVKKVTGESPSEFYLDLFGDEPDYWVKASPFHTLTGKIPPFLAVCSKQSRDACAQAERFVNKAKDFGGIASLLPISLSHNEINLQLGKAPCYTHKVDDFLEGLGADIAAQLHDSTSSTEENCVVN